MPDEKVESFWNKVARGGDDECWNWTGAIQGHGYGATASVAGSTLAHRAAWLLSHPGVKLTRADVVRHTCDNRRCCNPAHLVCGSYLENSQDMVAKGRSRHGERHYLSSLTDAQVKEIAKQCAAGEKPWRQIAAENGVTTRWLKRVMRGVTWGHVTGIAPVTMEEPLVSECPVCGREVVRRTLHSKVYCSTYCQQRAWKKRNPEHVREQQRKWVKQRQQQQRRQQQGAS